MAVGGLMALSVPVWRRLSSVLAALAGWAGWELILLGCLRLGSATAYPGVAALLPVLGTALVIATGCAQPRGEVGPVLAVRPLRQLGRYSWYLWHWPVLVLAPVAAGHALSLGTGLAALALSAGLTVLTTYAIEDTLRFAAALRCSPPHSLLAGGVITAVGVTASLLVLLAVPGPVGSGATGPDTPAKHHRGTNRPSIGCEQPCHARPQGSLVPRPSPHRAGPGPRRGIGRHVADRLAVGVTGSAAEWELVYAVAAGVPGAQVCTELDPAGAHRRALAGPPGGRQRHWADASDCGPGHSDGGDLSGGGRWRLRATRRAP